MDVPKMGVAKSDTMTDEQMERIARALSEPRRLQMLRQIGACEGAMACSALVQLHDVGAGTISRHVKELETAGLIKGTRNGKCMDYVLRRDVLSAYLARLATI
jgi:ArsR family transcriptional regulator, arsenate/arsenite/antimonite-responsive transcriptional repressor